MKATVAQTPVWGTDASLQVTKKFFDQGGATLQGTAGLQQHFGGLPGTMKADPSVGLEFNYLPSGESIGYLICRMTGGTETNCIGRQ